MAVRTIASRGAFIVRAHIKPSEDSLPCQWGYRRQCPRGGESFPLGVGTHQSTASLFGVSRRYPENKRNYQCQTTSIPVMYLLSLEPTSLDVITTGMMQFGNKLSICGTEANLVAILNFCGAGLWHPFEELKIPVSGAPRDPRWFNRMAFVDFAHRS